LAVSMPTITQQWYDSALSPRVPSVDWLPWEESSHMTIQENVV